MVWEFPAVSHTRIDFWKEPQYNRKSVLILSVLFGAFGLHHLYLRSPQTWLLYLIGNTLSLGFWYWFDISQLSQDVEVLNKEGLSLPWGPAGIAQGMFVCKDNVQTGGSAESATSTFESAPNPMWFMLYALTIPITFVSRAIAGDYNNALLGFLNIFIIPLGLLMNGFSIVVEYFNLFFKPADLFFSGIQRAAPFTFFGFDSTGHSKNITGRIFSEEECDSDGFFIKLLKALLSVVLPLAQRFLPAEITIAIQTALATGKAVKNTVVTTVETGRKVATEVGSLATQIPGAVTSGISSAQSAISTATQSGGGSLVNQDKSSTDYLALFGFVAVVGGGFLLHFGRSLSNAYSYSFGQNDSPPKA
jgi:hypothetical protein